MIIRPTAARRRSELIVVILALVVVAGLAYGPYVAHGGFYRDDWANLATYRFAHGSRYWATVRSLHAGLGGRPLLALLLPLEDAAFGSSPVPYLVVAVALGIATSLCVYLVLRTLSMGTLPAAAIAVMALLFPWSDATRLWATDSVTTVSICFFCLGLVVALRGLTRRGRAAVAMHAAADALYLLSILTYEATGAAALLAGVLYLKRAPAKVAIRCWIADAVVVLGALTYSLVVTAGPRHVGSLGARVGDLPQFARQSALLLASALLPVGSLSAPAQAIVLLAVALLVGTAVVRLRQRPGAELSRWAWWALVGALTIAAAYFMFLGSTLKPLSPGVDNRTNVLAGPAWCLLVVALLATAANLLVRSGRWAAACAGAATVLIAVGYAVQLRDDQSNWRRAATLQYTVLAAFRRDLPPLPSGSTVLSFGAPGHTAPEVPVFDKPGDLQGALQLEQRNGTLRAYPVFAGVAVRCERDDLVVAGPSDYGTFRVGYGRTFFVDVRAGERRRISTYLDCARAPELTDATPRG